MPYRIFSQAILRKPGKSIIDALAQDPNHQKPDYEQTISEYMAYAKTLEEKMGLSVIICEADEQFPDGNFVEDTYLILGRKLTIELNPGAPSRAKEYSSLEASLPKELPIKKLSKNFTIDGGDILKDGKDVYVGLSTRTQQGAIDELTIIVTPLGYKVHTVLVPEGLHLKSGMTCILRNHFIVQAIFEGIMKALQRDNNQIIYFVVPPEEYYAANVLPINGKIMIPTGCPKTKEYIAQFYRAEDIHEVNTQQARLVDGALTCSSLLFR